LTEEEVEELAVRLKCAHGSGLGEDSGDERGSADRDQTATVRATRGDHRLFPP
jgi:hypothetical protein